MVKTASEYWKVMLDMTPFFGKLVNHVNSILYNNAIGHQTLIKNINLISDYTDTASLRFTLLLAAFDNLKEIENSAKIELTFDEEYEVSFRAEYHFFAFITFVTSFLNSLAWLLKLVYNIKFDRMKRTDIDLRKNKEDFLKQIEIKNKPLHIFILKNLDEWIEDINDYRDTLLHRQELKLIGINERKLYMPIHPEIVASVDIDIESEEKHEKSIKEAWQKIGDMTKPMIPYCNKILIETAKFCDVISEKLFKEL